MFDQDFTLVYSIQAHTASIQRLMSLPNGYVASASVDNTSKIWSLTNNNWELKRNYTGHTGPIHSIECIGTDAIATGSYDNTIKIWMISTGMTNKTINTTTGVRSLRLLSNGYYLAAGLYSTWKINIYNIHTGDLISILTGHTSSINDLVVISSNLLASSSSDQSIRIWNLTTNTIKFILTGHTDDVFGLKLISATILASGSWDKSIKFWDITTGNSTKTLTNQNGTIYWGIDMLNSQALLSGSMDQSIVFWNLSSYQIINKINTSLQVKVLCVFNSTS